MIAHNRISDILRHWDVDGTTIRNVVYQDSGEINPNVFLIDEKYVLKIFTLPGTASCNVQILDALHRCDISAAAPIQTKEEAYVATDGELYYILTHRIDGEEVSVKEVYENPQLAHYLGKVIGRLHLALKENDQILCNERNIYDEVINCWLEPAKKVMGLSDDFCADYRDTFGKLHPQLPVQIIHRDPNPSNIMMKDGKCVGFVDFDLSQRSIRLFDPCYAATGILCSTAEKDWDPWLSVFQSIIHGYDSVIHLTDEEKQAVPYVVYSIQLICVGFFSTQEKFAELTKTNAAMLQWLLDHRDALEF